MSARPGPPLARWLTQVLVFGGLAEACVVTTYEGPGDPPRLPASPRPTVSEPLEPPEPPGEGDPGSEASTKPGPTAISASHLLVMHRGSLRAPAGITRSREEARQRAEEALARARAGEDFAELVKEYSDEPGAALREGKLGRFTRDAMIQQFSDAAFALDVGELSDVIETPYGFHVILRTE